MKNRTFVFIALIMAFVLSLCLMSCGKSDSDNGSGDTGEIVTPGGNEEGSGERPSGGNGSGGVFPTSIPTSWTDLFMM